MSTMIDARREAFERAAQQPEEEQAALATLIMRTLDDDVKWEMLLASPLTPEALDLLAAEAIAEDDARQTEQITGD